MGLSGGGFCRFFAALFVVAGLSVGLASAIVPREPGGRLDERVRARPGGRIALRGAPLAELPDGDPLRVGWERFGASRGGRWSVWLDDRSGLPLLAIGGGIPWVAGRGNSLDGPPATMANLESLARDFLRRHAELLGRWDDQLVLDEAASGAAGGHTWLVAFRREVAGVPVDGARYEFHVSHGNLVAFGARRFGPVPAPGELLTAEAARARLLEYLTPSDVSGVADTVPPALVWIALDPAGSDGALWSGPRGAGYRFVPAWRFVLRAPGEPPTWVAEVHARSGEVLALFDDTRYERIQGGVHPISNDGTCPDGCEQPGYPMPFADYTEDAGPVRYTGDHGLYDCSTIGAGMTTTLAGRYVGVFDLCGQVLESVACDGALDLGVGPGADCSVAAGASPGNTRATRTSFYHLNVAMQKGRAWLPSNGWLKQQLVDNVNIDSSCNAFWDGAVNFYTSGSGCRNTGEIQGVVVHEWGHGIDQNDGGGYDNPSEAYADVVAFFESRESCIGPGFYLSQNCSGYGDSCLNCTGVRDLDWDQRQDHLPATPFDFVRSRCSGGGGPCGGEVHCEGYVAGEAIWDLANRDLPASGLDPDSSWQLAEKLFYVSRKGSTGDAYNCSSISWDSDGCGTNSWFHKLRLADDDDGDLSNGTPHAAAIFAAFDRHDIACGLASDASNRNSSSCPALAAPTITGARGLSNAVELTWDPVPGAESYTILRSDLGCNRGQVIVGTTPGAAVSFVDDGLANGFTVHHRVLATVANDACDGPVSACSSATPQPLAGIVRFRRDAFPCGGGITLRVRDANAGGGTVTVNVRSDSEPAPETVVLTESPPGSGTYLGQIPSSGDPPAPDGRLSTAHGDLLTAEYVDADDGEGGTNLLRQHTAEVDCVVPVISGVHDQAIGVDRASVLWTTDEIADSLVRFGEATPPARAAEGNPRTIAHETELLGLDECRVYAYEVESADPAGNAAVDDNGGAYYRFETLGDFGAGPQSCHAGRVNVGAPEWPCTATVTFTVSDTDLNSDPSLAETATVLVSSSTEADAETVTATENGPDTHIFSGSVPVAAGAPAPDGVVQVEHGDLLTIAYRDADDGSGAPAVHFATAQLDCAGPAISGLRLDSLTDARVTVLWDTDEPADTVVEWGATPALGQSVSNPLLATFHSTVLNQFDLCQEAYVRVSSTDEFGNTTLVADDGGQPFRFRTWDIPGLYWMDRFESGGAGWTLEGEWEIGAPQGLGGSNGPPDPAAAYNHQGILGHDLSGQGTFGGDYEPLRTESATSPPQNASTWNGTKLIVHRRLVSGGGDDASLWLWANGIPHLLYRTFGVANIELQFTPVPHNIAGFVDGAASVFLEFEQTSDAVGQFGGWNVDDVIFKDGTLPDYAACGGCGTPPAFAGVTSAADNDACGADGVTVSWEPAVSWGSGGTGTYAVYRDTAPGFVPSPANRIAAGVAGLAYNDALAPPDQTLYYVVRAENDETCGGGPANGGLTDANTVYAAVQETTTRPLPPELTTVRGRVAAAAHARLDWQPVAEATSYRVYRSTSPQPGGFTFLAETPDLFHEDVGAATDPATYYYDVRPVNACNQETP